MIAFVFPFFFGRGTVDFNKFNCEMPISHCSLLALRRATLTEITVYINNNKRRNETEVDFSLFESLYIPHVGQQSPCDAGTNFSQGKKKSHLMLPWQPLAPRSHEHDLQPMSLYWIGFCGM